MTPERKRAQETFADAREEVLILLLRANLGGLVAEMAVARLVAATREDERFEVAEQRRAARIAISEVGAPY